MLQYKSLPVGRQVRRNDVEERTNVGNKINVKMKSCEQLAMSLECKNCKLKTQNCILAVMNNRK